MRMKAKHPTYDGVYEIEMEIEIDWDQLARYFAKRLSTSKDGVSQLQYGAITATRISETKTKGE